MQIEKRQRCILPPAQAATHRDARIASDHAAIFPTRLALARWTRGGDIPHVFASGNQPLRAAWYAQAQRGFQGWLEAGGFHQCAAVAAVAAAEVQDDGVDRPPAQGSK